MRLTVKTKIWMTVLTVVLMFAFFILVYFPAVQEQYLLKNYNKEVQNLANTVALGVKIAITEENFEGVQTAMDFVKEDPHLLYISMLQKDTVWNDEHTKYKVETTVFKTFPESITVDVAAKSNDSIIIKKSPFVTPQMSGEIMLGFTTAEIVLAKKQIRFTSIIVSAVVFAIGIIIGFWLARNISVPVLALRDAARKVGEGDLTQTVSGTSRDEIGELGVAFNKMVNDLGKARKEVEDRTSELMIAKKKTDELLLNILPAETAEELKATGFAKAKNYELVTVLFSDFKRFSEISEKMKPEQLVAELNYCFSAFDSITYKYGIEKIKTIGDAYMCAGGLPVKNETHAADTVRAAIELRQFMHSYKLEKEAKGEAAFEIRIGIHTGSVVAGIVGLKKFAYDIWGNTVNIASRMESTSEPGKINISGSTYEIVKSDFICSWRGKIMAKGIGELDMYFVEDAL
ncbi:MAG: Adenylate cyclase, class 3 [Segetibacter sp.]|nr:Adenylate cyclase, class 3 [Segetibacter sp.]